MRQTGANTNFYSFDMLWSKAREDVASYSMHESVEEINKSFEESVWRAERLTGFHRAGVGMCGTASGSTRPPEGSHARQLMSYVVTIERVMTW